MKLQSIFFRLLLFTCLLISCLEKLDAVGSDDAIEEWRSKVEQSMASFDRRKEEASKCRFLVMLLNRASLDNSESLEHAIPRLISDCYRSMNWIVWRKLLQLGSNWSHNETPEFALQELDHLQDNTNLFIQFAGKSYSAREFAELIVRKAFEDGQQYCAHFLTGILSEFTYLVKRLFKEDPNLASLRSITVNDFVGPNSPLYSIEMLERESQSHHNNLPIYQMLQANAKCLHQNDQIDDKFNADLSRLLQIKLDCKWLNIFLLQKLSNELRYDQVSNELLSQANLVLKDCLLQLRKEIGHLEPIWSERVQSFSLMLIDYIANKFLVTNHFSSNLLDRINPRSIMNHRMELNLFFDPKSTMKYKARLLNMAKLYESGQGVCDDLKQLDFYSSRNNSLKSRSLIDKITALLGNNLLQLDDKSDLLDHTFRFVLVLNVCRNIDLYKS